MTTVRHTFQSAKSDSGDDTIVRPSDWNADHTLIDPVEEQFGTPDTVFDFSTSSLTGLTTYGSPDTLNANTSLSGQLVIQDDDALFVGAYTTLANPGTVVTCLTDSLTESNYQWTGLAVGDSSFTNFVLGAIRYDSGKGLRGIRQPSNTQFGPTQYLHLLGGAPVYFGIRVASSTDVSYYASRSGKLWVPILATDNPGFTVAAAGLIVGVFGGGPKVTGVYDYLKMWNSAKTFLT